MRSTAAEPIAITTVGPFGRTVATSLRRLRDDVIETSSDGDYRIDATSSNYRMRVVASWRLAPRLCDLHDRECHEARRPFVPLILDSGLLRLGPVSCPGHAGCWTCWTQRLLQHSPQSAARAALLSHYDENPGDGPAGHIAPLAAIGAAQVARIIEAIDRGHDVAGHVWQLDLLTRRMTTSTVVGVHGCPRCGLRRSPAWRSVADMREALSSLWVPRE